MISYMFSAQLTAPWYRYTNRLARLNLNIPLQTRECVSLTDFCDSLYTLLKVMCTRCVRTHSSIRLYCKLNALLTWILLRYRRATSLRGG